jgi:glycosyltransferase involved in cell wall biosynthesis
MRLVVIGKCPPVQGGVARLTYATCLELARRGHEVHLVTNADEVEPFYRQLFLPGDAEFADGGHQPGFHRHPISPMGKLGFTPESPAYGSRLLGKALEVARSASADFLVGWYFQPYGIVAAQAAQACCIPYAILHAGSDLSQLARHPDLRQAFAWMASSATAVFTVDRDDTRKALEELGVPGKKCRVPTGHRPLQQAYPFSAPFHVDEVHKHSAQHLLSYPLDRRLLERVCELNEKPFSRHVPTVGLYGKVGTERGSYDLLQALADLAGRGVQFSFLALAAGWPQGLERFFTLVLESPHLAAQTWIFPPVAHWRIPGFLETCDIACYFERGFDIAYHFSSVPLEVLSCGVCLLCSKEMASKYLYRHLLVHEANCVLVEDPRNVKALAGCLEQVIQDTDKRARIALRGFLSAASLFESLDRRQLCRDGIADCIEKVAEEARRGRYPTPC